MGANGAGKSTLVADRLRPDRGRRRHDGRWPASRIAPRRVARRSAPGVQIVLQEPTLIPTLSVAENLFLADLPRRSGLVAPRPCTRGDAGAAGRRPGGPRPATAGRRARRRPAAARRDRRGAGAPCRVLILDEPTAALTDAEIERLFAHLRRLARGGHGDPLHQPSAGGDPPALPIASRVLRDGRLVGDARRRPTRRSSEAVRADGRATRRAGRGRARGRGRPVRSHCGSSTCRAAACRATSASRSAAARSSAWPVWSARGGPRRCAPSSAPIGRRRAHQPGRWPAARDPRARATPCGPASAWCPRIARRRACCLPQSVRTNMTLATLPAFARLGVDRPAVAKRGRRRGDPQPVRGPQRVGRAARRRAERRQPAEGVLGRWLLRDPDVLLIDEPTRGIDVGAKLAVHAALRDLAARGKALVVVSSELRS